MSPALGRVPGSCYVERYHEDPMTHYAGSIAHQYAAAATQVGGLPATQVQLQGPDTYNIPSWSYQADASRVSALRKIVLEYGRDPRIATLAVQIVKGAGVQPRDYKGQAAALLKWVQTRIYYMNEAGERLQSPEYTLRVGYGDCDDMAILLAALLESCRIPWRFVLSGAGPDKRPRRWIEGQPKIRGVKWSHIYLAVGDQPFNPKRWTYAEPTLKTAPLGWDVVAATRNGKTILPEMAGILDDASSKVGTELVKLKGELAEQLHWRKLVVNTLVGGVGLLITGLVVQPFISRIRTKARRRR